MHTLIKAQIIAEATAHSTVEVCGFIVLTPVPIIISCANVASDPTTSFQINPADYIAAKQRGQLVGLYHSHPRPGSFSEADMGYGNELAIPLYLYDVTGQSWHEYIPSTYAAPLIGRQFSWGFNDCFGLIRDAYRQDHGIFIADYDRAEDFQDTGDRRMWDNFEKEGFVALLGLGEAKKGDAMIFATNSMPQHVGYFMGGNQILHHPLNAMSRLNQFNSNWQRRLKAIVRHKTMF